jgi:Carboxypeptidase regulatory-like domain
MRLMFAFPLLFAPLLPGQGGGSVQGKVVNPNSGEPVAGAEIVLFTRQALRYETTSDAAGGFQFADVKAGNYEIRFEKEGYSFGRREPAGPYRIAAGQPAIHIRLELSRHATLSGRVVDIEGKPVRALVKLAGGGPAAAANENGEFAMKDVEPGFYTLVAIPPAESAQNGVKGVTEEARIEQIPTFYPAASDSAGGQKIVVRGDTDIEGFEIRMQAAEVHRVRGVVLDDNGSLAPNATVSLAPITMLPGGVTSISQNSQGAHLTILGPHRGAGPEQVQTKTDSNGTFEFPSVPAGDWRIAAAIPVTNLDSPPIAAGAVAALVGHDDILGLRIQKGSPFTLTQTIDWGDLPQRAERVALIPADGQSVGVGFVRGQTVPGRYYIAPSVSAGYYPDSVTLGGRDVMGQAVDLFPGSPPVQVSYKAAHGSVQGKVDNALSTVILIPEQVTTIGFGRMAQAKPDGTFEMPGVAPGSYIIAALSGAGFQTRLDSALLAKVAAIGARVRVEQGPVAGIELGATPWLQ